MKVTSLAEKRYEKFAANTYDIRLGESYIAHKKKDIRKAMIKGYLELLTNYNTKGEDVNAGH